MGNFNDTKPDCPTWDRCEFLCPPGQTWYNETFDVRHNGVYICDMYDSRLWESYQRDNVTFLCVDEPCGHPNVDFGAGIDYECADSGCNFTCSDGLTAFPSSVTCNNHDFWEDVTISCLGGKQF